MTENNEQLPQPEAQTEAESEQKDEDTMEFEVRVDTGQSIGGVGGAVCVEWK